MSPGSEDIPSDAALLIVDLQNGFCPGGNLAVPDGDEVVPVANAWVERFEKAGRPVVYSRDWHPENHVSFKDRGGPWPPHCVGGTDDAAFHPDLKFPPLATVVSKATDPDEDSYSAFDKTPLADELQARGVRKLYILGLATDYCVKASALDALEAGFDVTVVTDGVRPVEVNPGDGDRALKAVEEAGAHLI